MLLQRVKYVCSSAEAGRGGEGSADGSARHCTLGGLLTSCGYDGHSGSLWCIDAVSSSASRAGLDDVVTLLEESLECMATGTQMVGLLPAAAAAPAGDAFWRNAFAQNGMIVTGIDDAPGAEGAPCFVVTGEKIWPSAAQEDRYRLHVENIEDDADEDYFDHVV